MDQIVHTTPVIRCIIWREEECSILFCRRDAVDEETAEVLGSHWDLPLTTPMSGEAETEAAERVTYDAAGILATEACLLRQFPADFSNTRFNPSHHFVLLTGLSGRFDKDDYAKGKEGTWQWISIDMLNFYAIRRETLAMIAFAMKGHH